MATQNFTHESRHSKGTTFSKTLAMAAASAVIAAIASCQRAPQWHMTEGVAWNTTYRIVYQTPSALDDSIIHIMKEVEMSLSPFNAASLISRINRNETDSTDAMIVRVFNISQQVNHLSNGKFDPTVAPLVNLWGFGYDSRAREQIEHSGNAEEFSIPQEEIDSAIQRVGIARCSLHNGRMQKKHPGTTFNFSAVTKGFGCDMVAEMLHRNGAENYMVEIGGEIALAGHNPDGERWRIQIDTPVESTAPVHEALRVITPPDGGVATSGNYRNFHDTRRYGRIGHTIDPISGMPSHTDIASATVTAPDCATADALATACMASSAEDALHTIENTPGTECLLVVCDMDSMRIVTTRGFPKNIN